MATCASCHSIVRPFRDKIVIQDKFFGEIITTKLKFNKCSNCGRLSFPSSTVKIIDKFRYERKHSLLKKQPIDEFITASETADLLEITRQALHKNLIIRGLVFNTTMWGKHFYLKKSVDRFKKRGDGRYSLIRDNYKKLQFFTFKDLYYDPEIDIKILHVNQKFVGKSRDLLLETGQESEEVRPDVDKKDKMPAAVYGFMTAS